MNNFQDILKEQELSYGPLWCNQGVHKIAKEIQLLKPDVFDNMFLGMGGFNTEKIVLTSIGNFLGGSGAEEVLVQTEIFGPDTVKDLMNGRHYNCSRRGLNIFFTILAFDIKYTQNIYSSSCHFI